MGLRFLLICLLAALSAGCAPWHVPPGPALHAPSWNKEEITAPDGARLPLRRWEPADNPRGIVIALHGFNDYSKAFEAPAKSLARAGIATYAYDQRGFGRAPNKGFWSSVDGMTDDLRVAAQLVRDAHPDVPFFILGESMGAAVIMAAMDQDRPPPSADGYVLSAPAVWARRVMPSWQRIGLEFFAHTIPLFHVTGQGFNRTPSDNLSMLRKLGRDPLVIKYTRIDTIYGLVNLMDAALNAVSQLPSNTLVLIGQKEDVMPNEAISAFSEALPKTSCVKVARYSSGHHMLLRDLKADVVLGDLAAWMANPEHALPSGADRIKSTSEGSGAPAPLAVNCDVSSARP
jgi:alpha-beta hydrolase superfamily lysophospholipase